MNAQEAMRNTHTKAIKEQQHTDYVNNVMKWAELHIDTVFLSTFSKEFFAQQVPGAELIAISCNNRTKVIEGAVADNPRELFYFTGCESSGDRRVYGITIHWKNETGSTQFSQLYITLRIVKYDTYLAVGARETFYNISRLLGVRVELPSPADNCAEYMHELFLTLFMSWVAEMHTIPRCESDVVPEPMQGCCDVWNNKQKVV